MNAKTDIIIAEARKLSVEERLEIADAILATLDAPDAEHDAAWLAEAKDRLAAHRRGELSARDFDDVLAKYSDP